MGIISGSGSFRGQFGDHFRVGDHFGVGIISGAVQIQGGDQPCSMLSLLSTRKIILNILPELKYNAFICSLSAKIHEFTLRCVARQTGYIALAMEFTKPQIISKQVKRGNSDSEYIPRVRQQYEINLKPRHMRDELSHRFLLVLY